MDQNVITNENKYQFILENANDLISILNERLEYEYINETVHRKLMGYTSQDLIGKTSLNLIHPDDYEKAVKEWREGFTQGEGAAEIRIKDKAGNYHWLEMRGSTFVDTDGKKKGLVISRDITERKKAEKEIINLAKFPSENPNPVLRATKEKVIYINEAGEKLFNVIEGESVPLLMLDTVNEVFSVKEIKRLEIEHGNQIYSYIITPVEAEDYVNIYGRDITELKKAEKEIANLAKFPSENPNPVLRVAKEKVIYINKSGESLFNIREGSSIPPIIQDEVNMALDTNTAKTMEIELNNCIYSIDITPIKGEEYANVYGRDITERKRAENALKGSEEKYKNLSREMEMILDHIPALIFYKDAENNFIRVNKYVADAHNTSKEEINGKNLFNLYPKENAQAYWDDDLEVIRSGNPKLNIEEPWDTIEGRKWVSTSKIPFVDENGKIIGIVGFSLDITERKKAELLLKESEKKYRHLFENSPLSLILINNRGVYIDVNSGTEKLFGHKRDELIGNDFRNFSIVPKEFLPLFEKRLDLIFKGEDLEPVEFRTYRKDGKSIWISSHISLVRLGNEYLILIIGQDITDKKEAERELIRLNKLKSELLTRSSHELKTPLMSIKGFTELLLLKYKEILYEDELYLVNEIRKGCFRLETLVDDILKTAELESGTIHLEKSEEDLSLIIKKCVRELKGFADSRNQNINLMLYDKLITSLERKQIFQAINNLLINAIKYTPPNGKIEIHSEIKKNFFIISIKDSGIGFSVEEKQRVFKRFGKIERYGQGYDVVSEGSGLGLYISRKIIELHGGKIWVESEGRSKGSTFYFSLPIMIK